MRNLTLVGKVGYPDPLHLDNFLKGSSSSSVPSKEKWTRMSRQHMPRDWAVPRALLRFISGVVQSCPATLPSLVTDWRVLIKGTNNFGCWTLLNILNKAVVPTN